jgi:hypothetical protein
LRPPRCPFALVVPTPAGVNQRKRELEGCNGAYARIAQKKNPRAPMVSVISRPEWSGCTETSRVDPVCNARDAICRILDEPAPRSAPAPSARGEVAGRQGAAHGRHHLSAIVSE